MAGVRGEPDREPLEEASVSSLGIMNHSILEILESGAATFVKALAGRLETPAEPGIMLETIVEPIVFRSEADQHPGRLAVPGNHDLLGLGETQVLREIILYF